MIIVQDAGLGHSFDLNVLLVLNSVLFLLLWTCHIIYVVVFSIYIYILIMAVWHMHALHD